MSKRLGYFTVKDTQIVNRLKVLKPSLEKKKSPFHYTPTNIAKSKNNNSN